MTRIKIYYIIFFISHLGYSAEYCTASGSSGSSLGRSTAGCMETILPDSRLCYGTSGRHHITGKSDYIPVHSNNIGYSNNSISALKKYDNDDHFTFLSGLFTLISLISFLFEISVYIILSYLLYHENEKWWFGLTVAFTAIPIVIVNFFSIKW